MIAKTPVHSMSQLEYLIALVSIIVGLGLTDLARSLRELVRPGREVRWHWLPLAWAAIAFTVIVQIWWSSFRLLQDAMFSRAVAFFPVLLGFLVLYLICAFALPDPEWMRQRGSQGESGSSEPNTSGDRPLDLKAFYFSPAHRRWFFGAFIGLLLLTQLLNVAKWGLDGEGPMGPTRLVQNAATNLVAAALLGGVIATDRRWVHVGTVLLIAGAVIYTLVMGLSPIG
jgi:hypothetical protein